MGDYNRGALPDPCYRMSTGDGSRWRSVEFGDGTGYVRLDALKLETDERDQLIRDLLAAYFDGIECNLGDCRDCSHRDWPNPCEGWLLFDRAEQAGIEV